jgi:hypothetical protein
MGETSDQATVTPASANADGDDGTNGEDAPARGHKARLVAAVGLAGLGDRLSTVRHAGHDGPDKTKPGKTKPGKTKAMADATARATAHATAHKAAKDARPHDTRVRTASAADAHRRTVQGATPVRLALKDAKAIK